MDKKEGSSFISFLLGVLLCGAVITSFLLRDAATPDKEEMIRGLIEDKYIGEVSEKDLEDGKYRGMLDSLGDKYSTYFNTEEYEELMYGTHSTDKGIGIYVYVDEETGKAVIAGTIEGTPAEEAGIKENDIIISINGESVEGLELEMITARIKNSEDIVKLEIERDGEILDFELPLSEIPVDTVHYGKIENEDIGYIYISKFGTLTGEEFKEAYDYCISENVDSLIIDLRDDLGGLVESCTNALKVIVPEGLLVYTENKQGEINEFYSDCKDPISIPLVVLVNEKTASASEIFAGAIQDREIGILIGEKTYGKGIVQSIIDLQDGSAIRLTTSSYFTPDGRSLNGEGITPDITIADDEDTPEDEQLEKALEILKQEKKQDDL